MMVAIKDNKPIEVPRLICETREDKIRFLEGRLRREIRTLQQAEFERLAQTINITTPTVTSGIFSIPVSANATGNSWFTNYDCGITPGGNILCGTVTYSITYWY